MRYTGQFRNINNDLITVQITINNQATPIIQITRENGLWFSADPIQIETDVDDTFELPIKFIIASHIVPVTNTLCT